MGEIEVSCEGWSKPGDKYVLKGSCGLEYSLNRINRDLEEGYVRFPPRSTNIGGYLIFFALCIPLFCILYSLVRALFRRHAPRYTPPPLSRFWPGGWGGGGGGGGGNLPGFGGGRGGGGGGGAPPPPYSKDPAEARSGPGWLGGAAMGTAAGYLLSQARNRNTNNDRREQEWDRFRTGAPLGWEQDPMFGRGGFGGGYGGGTRAESSRMAGLRNRGNESSDLGEMRSATGFGGSNVR